VQALNDCPANVIVMGNLDPVGVFKMGTPDEVYAQTKALLEKTASFSNFVISSGCDIPPHASNANIEAFFRAVTEYNASV
jgi:uroporphyrinogen decarboxylase